MSSAQLNSPAAVYPVFSTAEDARRSRARFEAAASLIERVTDLAAVMMAAFLSYFAYRNMGIGKALHYSIGTVSTTALAFAVVFVLMLDHEGAYKRANSLLRIRETERILRVSIHAFGIVLPASFFFSFLFSRWIVILAIVFVPLTLIIEKQIAFLVIRHLHSRGYGVQNVVIYGAGFTGRSVFSALARSPKLGLRPVAIVDDDEGIVGQEIYSSSYRHEISAPVIAGPLAGDLIREWGCSLVVIAIPSMSRERLQEISADAFAARAEVAFVPQLSFGSETPSEYVDIDGVLIASLSQRARKRLYEAAKRMFDFVATLFLLALTAPLWAVIVILIRRDSKGPVLFRQMRVGCGGRFFELYKFRSMHVDAPKYDLHPTGTEDPRVTKIGSWLRRTSFDELPQLINVLKGDMSLVGPRPEMPFIVEGYNARHWQRLSVIPGLTGIWQISADRAFLIHENIQYDLYYIRHRNFFMDMAILLHTAVFAMKGV
jgi:exopolysaccharide biosynthesis polyprenyl glycosylphosphotransferase